MRQIKELNFYPEIKINDSLNRATNTRYLPISLDNPLKEHRTLKTDNRVICFQINNLIDRISLFPLF